MAIPVLCPGCGKRFKAPDRGAGRTVPCPACQTPIAIPAVLTTDDEEYRLADEPAKAPPAPAAPAAWQPAARTSRLAAPPAAEAAPAASPLAAAPAWVPPTQSSTPPWLRHLHWLLALATIPLAIHIFVPAETPEQLLSRINRSKAGPTVADASAVDARAPTGDVAAPVSQGATPTHVAAGPNPGGLSPTSEPAPDAAAPPDPAESAAPVSTKSAEEQLEELLAGRSLDDLLMEMPGHKLEGAFLARGSWMHWLFALVSVAAFLTFFVFLAWDKSAKAWHLVLLGLFTATIGVFMLLVVQFFASLGLIGGRGIVGAILAILALIGVSYNMALDPDMGFFASFIGFTAGVGFCEELCKALPILVYYRFQREQSWRGAFLWGMASGAGFGVSEGIMYSSDFYNGIAGPGIYVVRFISCVALHAIWTGSVAISINQRQYVLQEEDEEMWWMYWVGVLQVIAIPMVLHGLYDTMLKKELDFLALVVAAASFGYLAWQVGRLRKDDDVEERAAYVSRFIRSRLAGQEA